MSSNVARSPSRVLVRLRPGSLRQAVGMAILVAFLLMALATEWIAPYDPLETLRGANGELLRMEPPSREHWLGTTNLGRDVFSQVVYGSRAALMVGLAAATVVTFIGTTVGLIAGYYGKWTDEIAMRLVDIAYGLPFVPFVIILVSLLRPSLANTILAICLIFWRTSARVVRAQVLSLRERPFVKMAKVAGASNLRIIFVHLAPNVLPLVVVYMAIYVGFAIITETSVAFLGLGDPGVVSWGQMLNVAFATGAIRHAWWWVIPPGLCITLLVLATFLVSQGLERHANPRLRG